jgi:glycosyltransferase involved in cell wall biosynthesis
MNKLVIFMPSIEGGGVEKNLFIISNYLAKKILDTNLITADKIYNKKFKNIKIINPTFDISTNTSRKFKYFLCLYELIKLIKKDKKITVFAFQANFYCVIICKILFNVNLITRSNSSPSGWSQNLLKKIIFKYLFKLIDCVIVNSLDFKKELKKKFYVNSKCIYNPLNSHQIKKLSKQKINFSFFNGKKELKIINIGRFVDQKDHMTLLQAINIIKNKINFKMIIIGKGVNKNKILNFIKENNLSKKVKVLPFQENPFKYIKLSNIFILTSTFEGLPNVLLEAICLKKFIISSKCPTGPREILNGGKGGFLFDVGNYEELAKKIEEYYFNKHLYKKKIDYAYKKLHRFNYNGNLKKYLNVVLNHC